MKKLLIVLFGVLFLSLVSCEREENLKVTKTNERDLKVDNLKVAKTIGPDLKEYFGTLRTTIKNDFVQLQKNHAVYDNWRTAGEKMYEGNELALNNFKENFNQSQADFNLKSRSGFTSNDYQSNEINKIINEAQKFQTFEAYNNFINERFEYFLNDLTLSIESKKFMLTFLVSYSESLEFIVKNNNFGNHVTNGRSGYSARGWWGNWWKCIVSVVGGLVSGATTVGLGGAAVGTVTMPVIGTVAGGLVGAIGGGIGGALTGAAAGC